VGVVEVGCNPGSRDVELARGHWVRSVWPPPLQAVVRAMDTITTFAATKNAQAKINKFVVAGASKVTYYHRTVSFIT